MTTKVHGSQTVEKAGKGTVRNKREKRRTCNEAKMSGLDPKISKMVASFKHSVSSIIDLISTKIY